jgi:hypothetical protein
MIKRIFGVLLFAAAIVVFSPASKAQNVKGTTIPCNSNIDALMACWLDEVEAALQASPWDDMGPCTGVCQWVTDPDSPYAVYGNGAADDDYLIPDKEDPN